MNDRYAALIFDVVGSRTLEDRYAVQKKIRLTIDFLNTIYKDSIEKNVVTASGDEFQGLFNNIADAFAYAHSLEVYLYPIRIRCGIGYGDIKYLESSWGSTDIDGQAYYYARDAINGMPDKKSTDVIFIKTGYNIDKMLNTTLYACAGLKKRQTRTAKLIEFLLDFTYPYSKKNKYLIRQNKEFFLDILMDRLKLDDKEIIKTDKFDSYDIRNTMLNKNIVEDTLERILCESEFNQEKNLFMYTEYCPFGCAALIAPLTMTSFQNVAKAINGHSIRESRNLDGMIYDLLLKFDEIKGNLL